MTPSCPRCRRIALQPFATRDVEVLACGNCHGLWLDHAAASRVAQAALQDAVVAPAERLPCPVCTRTMAASRVKGVVVDRCDAHGLWFDHAELERVLAARPVKTDSSNDTLGWVVESISSIFDVFT
jgi:Zn-finger nucleic acid-binding protein